MSVWHRATGVVMSLGIALLVYWLAAAAAGREAYDQALTVFASPLTKIALFGWLLAFFYHLLNGLRHLGWDLGYGFEKAVARKTGTVVFIGAIVLTVLTWMYITARITAGVTGGLV